VLRRPVEPGVYGSLKFGRQLAKSGVVGSMGRSGTPAANAVADSFFATLQTELLDRHSWPTRDVLKTAIFDYIEVFYNRTRRHSKLDYLSPLAYEDGVPYLLQLAGRR
jgi:transposase InsO family protein